MKPYPKYKDSGEQWLGQIPDHWEMRKSKYIWQELNSVSETGKEQLLSVSQYDGVKPASENSRSESCKGYKIVAKDNLVINIMLAWLGGLGVSGYEGIVSPAYCVYRPIIDVNTRFLHYLYKTPMYLAEFARHSTGVVPSRWRMYTDDFGQVITLLPPLAEQEAMVAYLDEQTGKIDAAIEREQKMIDLLEERKQIIIQQAVTKGLNTNAKMKDSGIEWIGEMPEHWDKYKVKHLFKVSRGRVISREELVDGGEFPVYSSQTENNGCLGYLNTYDYDNEILTWTTDGARAGSVFHRIGKFNCTNVCGILCPHKGSTEFNIRYVYYSLGRAAFYNRRADIL
jgi:type I restriction enzyme S subunit